MSTSTFPHRTITSALVAVIAVIPVKIIAAQDAPAARVAVTPDSGAQWTTRPAGLSGVTHSAPMRDPFLQPAPPPSKILSVVDSPLEPPLKGQVTSVLVADSASVITLRADDGEGLVLGVGEYYAGWRLTAVTYDGARFAAAVGAYRFEKVLTFPARVARGTTKQMVREPRGVAAGDLPALPGVEAPLLPPHATPVPTRTAPSGTGSVPAMPHGNAPRMTDPITNPESRGGSAPRTNRS